MKKFLKGLSLTILTLVLFVATTLLLLLIPLKYIINKNVVKDMISSLEIEKMVTEDENFKSAIDEVFAPIYEETRQLGIEDKVVVKIMDSKEVKDLIGGITGNIVDYVITGKNQKLITTENIEDLVSTAINDIDASGYYKFSEKERDSVLKVVKNEVDELQEYIPDTKVIEDTLNKDDMKYLNIIRFVLGNELMMYTILIMVISFLGILALEYKKAKWIKWNAITILISSIFTSIITIILFIANNALFRLNYQYIYNIFSKTINFSSIISLSILVLMIITLIIYHMYLKKSLNKNSK